MNASLGEIATSAGLAGKVFHAFRLLDERDDTAQRGEVTLPRSFAATPPARIYVRIPYTPVYKPLRLRLQLDDGNGHTEYMVNPADNSRWFPVLREDEAGVSTPLCLSEYGEVEPEGIFCLILGEGCLALYSGVETDLRIGASKYQNEVFLLKAFPGNLYQFPLTGVGLIDFLHGNFENNGLAERLQAEFDGDNMIIINAYMDSATGELLLETKEKEDADG